MYPGIHARRNPAKPAVILAETGELRTYGDLDENSARLARLFHDAGLRSGDVVALLSDNQLECFDVYWAALRSGLYITAINRHLAVDEIAYIVNDSDARAVVASGSLRASAEGIVELTPGVAVRYAFGGTVANHDDYGDALRSAGLRLEEQPRGAEMLYSSGTTGRPKGIKPPLPGRSVDEPGDPIVAMLRGVYGITSENVYLSPAPVYHAAPLRWCGVMHSLGATVVMMHKFEPEPFLAAIERYAVSVTQVVPTMFVRMLKLPEATRHQYDVTSLKLAVHAAAPCPPEVKKAMIDWWGPIIHEYYGSTEANGMTFIDTAQWLEKPGSVGRSALGRIHICDDSGAELAAGETGLVYFERDELPFEYHNDPEKTKAAQHPAHPLWTTVGDVGSVDDEGFLYLADRKDFMIISGGVNIYPREIEDALALHPKVADVAVIGVPDPEMGEQVKAIVQPAPGGGAELEGELIAYLRDRIAHYKAPRSIAFVDELPRTPTGKLLKRLLKERFAAQPEEVSR
ncbi:acyl-CoA synthetase [Amycolatopsis acidiphila]|uniref:Acyl-CoA synthetase n=1 Tax=Amycolatopsis acidiphila TaxID=715473 RepID=A0A558AHU9_9PSEU|nr:acyl-CoA synthetase [Amycolatopsis acidiphila]TVT23856.1 acyl-CoA synthetase [Amycolatopsis acidiphila]UIJ61168.1 acyl-CoA synthetase [Amycolatopsis acidiphila]GHG86333.1 putative acyl-CoA ligase [Amycolatopsis acidiphila]